MKTQIRTLFQTKIFQQVYTDPEICTESRLDFLPLLCLRFRIFAQRSATTSSPPFISSPQSGIQTSTFPRLMPPNLSPSPLPSILFPFALYFHILPPSMYY